MGSSRPPIDEIFANALEKESAELREKYLDEICGESASLRLRLDKLIDAHLRAYSDFLEAPATGLDSRLKAEEGATVDVNPVVLEAGFAPTFASNEAVVLGGQGHSVLKSLSKRVSDVPNVTLHESQKDGSSVVQPSSPEIPKQESDDRYQMLGEIARGGMGAVIKGRDTDLGRDLAIKVLLDSHKDHPDYIRRFVEEAQIGGQLQHPGIAPVYELGQFRDERPFFTMKLVKGDTFAALLAARKTPGDDLPKLLGIFEQICQTMAYAHSKRVIHRDLKPANVMVGAFGEVQVMDWGLSKVLNSGGVADERKSLDRHRDISVIETRRSADSDVPGSVGSNTQFGSIMGTPAYMPPEQALGEIDQLDERADVFGLGAILAEILTGKPAYVADSSRELTRMASRGKLEACVERLDSCAAESQLIAICKQALAPEPDDRFRNASELSAEVTKHLEGVQQRLKQAELDRVEAETRSEEERRRKKLYFATTALMLLLAVGAFAATIVLGQLNESNKRLGQKNADQAKANMRLANEKEAERNKAVASKERLEKQYDIQRATKLAAETRHLQEEKPFLSLLLATEAYELAQQLGDPIVTRIAHETLLGVSQQVRTSRLLKGYEGSITKSLMSLDWLITQGDGRVYLWDLTMEQDSPPRRLGNENQQIEHIALTADSRWLVTGGAHLELWDLSSPQPELSPVTLAEDEINGLGLSPNGRWLVTLNAEDDVVKLWDLGIEDKYEPQVLHPEPPPKPPANAKITISNNARWLSISNARSAHRFLYDLDAEDRDNLVIGLPAPSEHPGTNMGPLVSPDDSRVVAGWDYMKVWELQDGVPPKLTKRFRSSDFQGGTKLFGKDSNFLYCKIAESPRIQRWDISSDDPLATRHEFVGLKAGKISMSISEDGRWLVGGDADGWACVWDLDSQESFEPKLRVRAHDQGIRSIAVHPNGKWFATIEASSSTYSGTARLWEVQGEDPASFPFVLNSQADDVDSATAISSDGRWIATEIQTNSVQLWDMEATDSNAYVRILQPQSSVISTLEIVQDHWLIAGCRAGTAIWDLTADDVAASMKYLSGPEGDNLYLMMTTGIAAVDASGRWLAQAHADNNIRVWDLSSDDWAASVRVLRGHENQLYSMTMSPDGRWLFTGGSKDDEFPLLRWDLDDPDRDPKPEVLKAKHKSYFHISTDSESRWMTVGHQSEDNTNFSIALWDLQNPSAKPRLLPHAGIGGPWRGSLSPKARWLYTPGQLVDIRDLENPIVYKLAADSKTFSCPMSPNGRWLAIGFRDGAVQLVDLHANDPSQSIRNLRGHEESVWCVRFSGDSKWLVTDASDGTIRRWCLDTDWLISELRDIAGRELTVQERVQYGL